jgi:hypothetical protein
MNLVLLGMGRLKVTLEKFARNVVKVGLILEIPGFRQLK